MKPIVFEVSDDQASPSLLAITIAGALAGVAMACAIYPLDTYKTRRQCRQGFKKAGGFQGLYKGFSTLAVGAVPINSIFFGSYETAKQFCEPCVTSYQLPIVHMFVATACRGLTSLVRVPIELAKQRKQTAIEQSKSTLAIWTEAYRKEGIRRGLYRGFASTVLRDMPFSFIQMPIWELLKSTLKSYTTGHITSLQSAMCGLFAGGIAAALTTPLDVAKTRIMLEDAKGVSYEQLRIRVILRQIYMESGIKGLYAGILPRMGLVMIGGFVFFGVYEELKTHLDDYTKRKSKIS